MLDSELRFKYFEPIIEWYVASQNNWSISTNKHGRYFTKYLDTATWAEIKATFANHSIKDNWKAFYKLVELFTNFAREVANERGFDYPTNLEKKMLEYYHASQENRAD